ncbi:MAG: PilZ domain-containing protein [Candidatus Omnitrophica bacterium]|nr:PilZ domain-containing protein [Candidatus Omnitrophota bacterium]
MNKRLYPRIKTSFPLRINSNVFGKVIDISETGFGIAFEKPLLLSNAVADIELSPNESIKTEFKIIWSKHLIQKNGFRYGACFIRLKERDLDYLRGMCIRETIKPIIDEITCSDDKQTVSDFWTIHCKKYMSQLDSLVNDIQNNKIRLTDACNKAGRITDDIVEKGHNLENLLSNKKLIKKSKECFRALLGPWAYRGKILKRAYEKPRGYPGDYFTIELVYNNKAISENIGYCSDMYFLNNEYAAAVRNRKDKMKDMLEKYLLKSRFNPTKILNIACGSCREIVEMLSTGFAPKNKTIFTLVDHDQEALDFSKKVLSPYASKLLEHRYLNHNVLNYIKDSQDYKKILGDYSLIYSIGLADYLPDRLLKLLISFWFDILQPNGTLILAHKDIIKYDPVAIDWWADWTFYPRHEEKLLNIIKEGISIDFDVQTERDKSGIILFVIITKR